MWEVKMPLGISKYRRFFYIANNLLVDATDLNIDVQEISNESDNELHEREPRVIKIKTYMRATASMKSP